MVECGVLNFDYSGATDNEIDSALDENEDDCLKLK